MISDTLPATKAATFAITFKDPSKMGMASPRGTGFFVSDDGSFITAAHVIADDSQPDRSTLDPSDLMLAKEPQTRMSDPGAAPGCHAAQIIEFIPEYDFALLRFDFQSNKHREWLAERSGFPFVQVSTSQLQEGSEVYSFGYPLSSSMIRHDTQGEAKVIFGHLDLSPRATSAIVSSTFDHTQVMYSSSDPLVYVLDKALNYGNSGGPIVSSATGHVHAFCSRFQPLYVPQPNIRDHNDQPLPVMMPSLYGIVTSLSNPAILKSLRQNGVNLAEG